MGAILGGLNPLISNVGEGFINQGYIVVEKNSILDMKGLSFSMPSLFEYLGYMVCLNRAWFFHKCFHKFRIHTCGHSWTCANIVEKEFRIVKGG